MNDGVALRPLALQQAGQLHRQEQSASPWPWSLQALHQSISGSHHCLALYRENAAAESSAVGYAVLSLTPAAAELLQLVVFRPWQRQRLGTSALQALMTYSVDRGAQQMWLEVRVSNATAIRLYLGAGFTETGRRKEYYPVIGMDDEFGGAGGERGPREDAILMSRSL